nr:MAG TPA: hypothetical protein [Caudoviricetes sp.]
MKKTIIICLIKIILLLLNKHFDNFYTFSANYLFDNNWIYILKFLKNQMKFNAYPNIGGGMMIAWFCYLYLKIKG